MPPLIKQRQVMLDEWLIADASPTSESSGTQSLASKRLLPLAQFLEAIKSAAVGKTLAPLLKPEDQDLEILLPLLPTLPLIAIQFGSSGEGRGYTQGRLLRERYGFKGELRACGAIRADQIYFLARCGFDAFDLATGEDAATALAQLNRFSVAYQEGLPGQQLTAPRYRYGAAKS